MATRRDIAADQPLGLAAGATLGAATATRSATLRIGSTWLPLSAADVAIIQQLDGKKTLPELLAASPAPLLALDVVRRLHDAGVLGAAPAPAATAVGARLPNGAVDVAMVAAALAAVAAVAWLAGALTATTTTNLAIWGAAAAVAWHTAPYLAGWGRRSANRMLGVPDSGARLRSWLTRKSLRNVVRDGPIDPIEQRYLSLAAWGFCHGFAVVVVAIGYALPQAAHHAMHGHFAGPPLWAALWRALPLLVTVAFAAPPLALLLLVLAWVGPQLLPRAASKPDQDDLLDADTAARFAEAMAALPMFGGVPAEQLAAVTATARKETYADRALILRQGDKGDRLCWLASGRVRVRVEDESGREHELAVLGAGALFGETALLQPVARTATVVADGRVEVAALQRNAFLAMLGELGAAADDVKDQLRTAAALRSHPLFQALDSEGLRDLLQSVAVTTLAAGQAAVKQGETGDVLYVVREGHFEVGRTTAGGTKKLARLRPGDWFGELALLGDGTRTATVTAAEPAIVVEVPRAAVEKAILRDVQAAMHLMQAASERLAALRAEDRA